MSDVKEKLSALGGFSCIALYDVTRSTPSLAVLNRYRAVMVFTRESFQNAEALGNTLADYIDAGNGVVFAGSLTMRYIRGRVVTGGYLPYQHDYGTPVAYSGRPELVVPAGRRHPVLTSVRSFRDGKRYQSETVVLPPGVVQIAAYDNGEPAVQTQAARNGGTLFECCCFSLPLHKRITNARVCCSTGPCHRAELLPAEQRLSAHSGWMR